MVPVAEVKYPTLKGLQVAQIFEGDVVTFGRGGNCQFRFGHAPVVDTSVPRLAGTLVAIEGRIVVNAPSHAGHRALEIHDGPQRIQIPVGRGLSLSGTFDVVVRGESKNWVLNIRVFESSDKSSSFGAEDPSTAHISMQLSAMQWQVLRAYYEPIRRGSPEPATHQEVAQSLGFHLNTVRNKIYEIRDLMYMHGLQMLDTKDARVAVVEAARIHGLIDL